MGEIANYNVEMYTSGKWGMPIHEGKVYDKTSKEEIKDKTFFVVEVTGFKTNRIRGTKLIVCEQNDNFYWVWTSKGVTGIGKDQCKVISEGMSISEAKKFRESLKV